MYEERVEVDVEKIMEEIRRKIQMDEDLRTMPSFESISIREGSSAAGQEGNIDWAVLTASLRYINANYDIPYYWSFGAPGIKTFMKRVVRKLVKCLIPPILVKQNSFNSHVVRCLNNLRNGVRELFARSDTQAEEISRLKEALSLQSAQVEKMSLLIESLSEQIMSLQEKTREIDQKAQQSELIQQEDEITNCIEA